jgi:RNA polymerase sigma-B factor
MSMSAPGSHRFPPMTSISRSTGPSGSSDARTGPTPRADEPASNARPRVNDEELAREELARAELNEAIRRYQTDGDPQALQTVLAACDWVAVTCARRMHRHGEPLEDLEQVAREAVIGAVGRFDLDRGVQFKSFAWATATGALRHHYRGRWQIRVPRALQELHLAVTKAVNVLTASELREPTVDEIAAHLDVAREDVILALDVSHAYLVESFDHRVGDRDRPYDRALGVVDPCIEAIPDTIQVRAMLESLPPTHRTVLTMHFFLGKTQSEVGEALGVSQAQVSRLMQSALVALRGGFEAAHRSTTVR